jgi:hypothetical protein
VQLLAAIHLLKPGLSQCRFDPLVADSTFQRIILSDATRGNLLRFREVADDEVPPNNL